MSARPCCSANDTQTNPDRSPHKLDEIVVTGSALPEPLRTIPRNVTVIDSEDIARSLGVSIHHTGAVLLITSTCMVATVVCQTGLLGFIELVVPQPCAGFWAWITASSYQPAPWAERRPWTCSPVCAGIGA